MAAVAFVELDERLVKKSSLEAISYASAVDAEVTAVVMGAIDESELAKIGAAGANKVLHATDEKLNQPNIMAYSSALAEAMDTTGAKILVMAKSSIADPISARVSVKVGAGLVSNVVSLPDLSDGFVVNRSIYTGKAFAQTKV